MGQGRKTRPGGLGEAGGKVSALLGRTRWSRDHEESHEAGAMAVENGKGGTSPSKVGAINMRWPLSCGGGIGVASGSACVNKKMILAALLILLDPCRLCS